MTDELDRRRHRLWRFLCGDYGPFSPMPDPPARPRETTVQLSGSNAIPGHDRLPVPCAALDCHKPAIWASTFYEAGFRYVAPVCRNHGEPLAPIQGVVGLDVWERRSFSRACDRMTPTDA